MEPNQDYADDLVRVRALQAVKNPQYMHRTALAYQITKYQDLDPIDVMSLAIREVLTAWDLDIDTVQGEAIHFWQNPVHVVPIE